MLVLASERNCVCDVAEAGRTTLAVGARPLHPSRLNPDAMTAILVVHPATLKVVCGVAKTPCQPPGVMFEDSTVTLAESPLAQATKLDWFPSYQASWIMRFTPPPTVTLVGFPLKNAK